MLEQVLMEIHNWFYTDIASGTYTIHDGGIALPFLKDGQYFRVCGSTFNDGLHRYGPDMEALTDETFTGAVWALAIPKAVIDLAREIADWQTKYGDTVSSPFQAESFGGYSFKERRNGQHRRLWRLEMGLFSAAEAIQEVEGTMNTDGQFSLFDLCAEPEPPKPMLPGKTLSDYAFLYTAGRAGRNSGIRFMMTLEDAQAWCESDLSKGNMHGNPWAYFFTSVENFCNCHWGQLKGATLDLRKLHDNGQWDEKISSLHLKKYDKHEIKDTLMAFGIEVLV